MNTSSSHPLWQSRTDLVAVWIAPTAKGIGSSHGLCEQDAFRALFFFTSQPPNYFLDSLQSNPENPSLFLETQPKGHPEKL